ncbi:MAG: LysR substrate-binding domain-containing protein [Aquisalimonadaceae bacterium]
MERRLPPLYALRAFVAAAHNASFARAADELCVTPAAVSRGIKSLEDYVGVRLFNRMHRKVELTSEGLRYFKEVGDVFDRVALATQNVAARQSHRPLRICAYPSFVINWLIPRWCRYMDGGFEVQFLTTLSHDVDFDHAEIDAAMLTDRAEYRNCRCDLLFTAHLVPVCSPALMTGDSRLEQPRDLRRVERLYSETRPDDWQRWLAVNGAEDMATAGGLRFESSNLMYEAAKAGMGVAIAILEVVQRELTSGSLVIPFAEQRPAPCPYYLIYPEDHEAHPSLVQFRNWVIAEYHR